MKTKDQQLLEQVYEQISKADVHHPMHSNLREYAKERLRKVREKNNEDIIEVLGELEKDAGAVFGTLAKSLHYRNLISNQELENYLSARD
jgi:hypothetical protein